jgi:membrane carboxypeptidase/penicillin-binding protein
MKRAVAMPAYQNIQEFDMPEGVTKVTIDPETLALATPECPVTREEVYIHGTEPTEFCPLHGGHMTSETAPGSWLSHVFGGDKEKGADGTSTIGPGDHPSSAQPAAADDQQPEEENKKGLFRRIFGIFGGKKDADKTSPASQDQQH